MDRPPRADATLTAVLLTAALVAPLAVAALAATSAAATHVDPVEIRWACGGGGGGRQGHPDGCGIDPVGGPPAVGPAGAATWGGAWVGDDEEVLGVVVDGPEGRQAGAVPVKMLSQHEVANTELAGVPVAITYCPLCGSGLTFERVAEVDGERRELNVAASGFLWRSDLVMWDPETGTLWNQIGGVPIGSLVDARVQAGHPDAELTVISTQIVQWGAFRDAHPDARMLQGVRSGYRDPYQGYYGSCSTGIFGGSDCDIDGLHPKARVVGVVLDDGTGEGSAGATAAAGTAIAYPVDRVVRTGGEVTHDVEGGPSLVVTASGAGATSVRDADTGEEVPSIISFWFAWLDHHPETQVWGEGPVGPTQPSTPGPSAVVVLAAVAAGAVLAGVLRGRAGRR